MSDEERRKELAEAYQALQREDPGFCSFGLVLDTSGPHPVWLPPSPSPEMIELRHIRQLLEDVPIVRDKASPREKTRRGGPPPASAEKKHRLIRGWLEAEKRGMTQDNYCESTGEVSSSQLRAWMRELKAKGEM